VTLDKSKAFALPEWRTLKVHPFALAFGMITGDEWADFVADIKANGLVEPCVLDKEGTLIDGRNRLKACDVAGVEPRFVTYDGDDIDGFIFAANCIPQLKAQTRSCKGESHRQGRVGGPRQINSGNVTFGPAV
jgi:hypothetical protein